MATHKKNYDKASPESNRRGFLFDQDSKRGDLGITNNRRNGSVFKRSSNQIDALTWSNRPRLDLQTFCSSRRPNMIGINTVLNQHEAL